MKQFFLFLVLIPTLTIGLFGCKKESNGVSNEVINQPTSAILSGNINSTRTLTADRVWTLKGYVYVTSGSKLIIEPGTKIISDISEKGALCIERGGQIIAEGTATKPIVFTSGKPDGQKSPGDWGGIVILGNAKTNRITEPTIEGGIGKGFGGTNDLDNSGILRYVRIEYAGIASQPNSEINALTLGGVGSGTIIENVQTIYANDDAFEFFGGTVNAKNLYAFATADDDFDFDFGYTGTITNGVAKRDPQFVDSGDAGNGVECDNDATGTNAQPYTHPKLYNMILIGPNVSTALANHNFALRFRRATQFTMKNSIIWGWMKGGLSLESNETAQFVKDGVSVFENNSVGTFNPTLNFISKATTILTNDQLKTLALSKSNKEIDVVIPELDKPIWINGWTRFPSKGN
jgi:hypothetical protein